MLSAFLDYYRALIVDKASGLPPGAVNRRLAPSTLTLAGLVHHLALVEHYWFNEVFLGEEPLEPWASVDWDADGDWDFNVADDLDFSLIRQRYEEACVLSRVAVGAATSLDQVAAKPGKELSLRWILIHMIEETARHVGHADLIRESLDGAVGDFRDE